jgi:uncharacterized repeat protein (TIGR01451 family)
VVTYVPTAAGKYVNKVSARAYCTNEVSAVAEADVEGIVALLLEVVDADPIAVGQQGQYVIIVTNQGTAPVTGIKVMADLDASWKYVSAVGQNTVQSGNKTVFAPFNLAVGEKKVINLNAQALSNGGVPKARVHVMVAADQIVGPGPEETETTTIYIPNQRQ